MWDGMSPVEGGQGWGAECGGGAAGGQMTSAVCIHSTCDNGRGRSGDDLRSRADGTAHPVLYSHGIGRGVMVRYWTSDVYELARAAGGDGRGVICVGILVREVRGDIGDGLVSAMQ